MKAFRGTAVLSVFVILLVAYTAWEYKKAGTDAENILQEKKLFSFQPEQVSQFMLVRGNETMVVERNGNGNDWKMKQPVEDDCETSAVDAFLYSLMIQKGKIFRGSEESGTIKWPDFGLEPPGSAINIVANGKTLSLQVSSKNAFDGSYYLRQGDELMLGDHGLAQIVGRDSSSLRSKHLWRDRDSKVETLQAEIDLNKVKEKFSIKKDGEKPVLDPAPAFKVDSAKLDQWLGAIYNLMASEIVSDSLTSEQKSNDLLQRPSLTMKIQYKKQDGTKSEWTLNMGQDRSDDVFMYTDKRPTVYKTSSHALQSLRVGREFFRDGKSPFSFSVEQAHEIEIQNGAIHYTFKKDGSNWNLAGGAPDVELNPEKLATLLQNLSGLEAQEFPKNGKGLKESQRINIRDSKGQTLLDFTWGDEFKAEQPWNKGMTFRFVKSNLEKDVLGVTSTKIASLIDPGLVVKKAESKKTDKK